MLWSQILQGASCQCDVSKWGGNAPLFRQSELSNSRTNHGANKKAGRLPTGAIRSVARSLITGDARIVLRQFQASLVLLCLFRSIAHTHAGVVGGSR